MNMDWLDLYLNELSRPENIKIVPPDVNTWNKPVLSIFQKRLIHDSVAQDEQQERMRLIQEARRQEEEAASSYGSIDSGSSNLLNLNGLQYLNEDINYTGELLTYSN